MANTAKPLVLANGIYLRTTQHSTKSHMDSADLMYLNKGRGKVTDLGLVQPFVTTGYLMNPYMYSFSGMGKNKVYVDDHLYKFSHPVAERPFYILEVLTPGDKVGIANTKFRVKMNSKKYDNGYVLTFDVHEPIQLRVTEDEIIKDGDGFIYTFQAKVSDNHRRGIPAMFLKPGTILFPVTTYETEFSTKYSSVPEFSGGEREYYNHVGYTRAQLSYSVTRNAAYGKIGRNAILNLKQAQDVIEMFSFRNGSLAHSLNLQGRQAVPVEKLYAEKYGKAGASKMRDDIVQRAWIPKIDALTMQLVEHFVETEAVFGAGGTIEWDGKGRYQTSLGLFHQLNMGNIISYNLFNLTLEKFEYFLAKQLKDRVEPFQNNNIIEISTGRGGMAMVRNWLRGIHQNYGMVWQAEPYVQGANANGTNHNLHFSTPNFTSYEMTNGYGKVRFVLNPALDPVEANEIVNPTIPLSGAIGGHRLSSYMFIINDIVDHESDNIVELVCSEDWDFERSVEVGKLPYMGQPRMNGTYQRSSNHPGYKVMVEKRHKAYFVKDTTKSLLIKPINPMTGKPIFHGFYQS